jgi:predicted nucleic acid-binding protein
MRRLFADTYYFVALANPRDQGHERAVEWTAGFDGELVTTAWVLAEFGNQMADPRNREEYVATVRGLQQSDQVQIVVADEDSFEEGLTLFKARPDKAWSMTDCISFSVMTRENLTEALTADHHFEQAGFVALLK